MNGIASCHHKGDDHDWIHHASSYRGFWCEDTRKADGLEGALGNLGEIAFYLQGIDFGFA